MSRRVLWQDLEAWLHHMEVVRNLSRHTLRAYEGDLGDFGSVVLISVVASGWSINTRRETRCRPSTYRDSGL